MYIIKGMIKMTIGIILTATVLVVLFPTDDIVTSVTSIPLTVRD